jgi:hypothetical protein
VAEEPDQVRELPVDFPGEPAHLGDGEEDVLPLVALGEVHTLAGEDVMRPSSTHQFRKDRNRP